MGYHLTSLLHAAVNAGTSPPLRHHCFSPLQVCLSPLTSTYLLPQAYLITHDLLTAGALRITTQHHAAPRSTTQHYAALRSTTQHYAALRSTTQHYAASRNTTQYHAIPRNTTQYHAIPRNTTHYASPRSITQYGNEQKD